MKKIFVIGILCLAVAVFVLFLTYGSNELLNESNAVSVPCDGVSLEVSATKQKLDFTIKSEKIDYIVYSSFQKSMALEMLQDGKWYVVSKTKLSMDMEEPVSPDSSVAREIKWKDYYEHDLSKGRYRLVFTFWAMQGGQQGDNYTIMQEFMVD